MPPRCTKKIDGTHIGYSFAQARDFWRELLASRFRLPELPRLDSDLLVVLVAGGVKELLNLAVGQSFDHTRFEEVCLATSGTDLANRPLKILERVVSRGKHVNSVLDRHRTDPLHAPRDL